jgi:hypothetical protein
VNITKVVLAIISLNFSRWLTVIATVTFTGVLDGFDVRVTVNIHHDSPHFSVKYLLLF